MNLRSTYAFAVWLAIVTPAFAQIEAVIPWAPAPMHADGRKHLLYEIHLTNFIPLTCLLERVEISTRAGERFGDFAGQELTDALDHPGFNTGGTDTRVIGPRCWPGPLRLLRTSPARKLTREGRRSRTARTGAGPAREFRQFRRAAFTLSRQPRAQTRYRRRIAV